MILSDRTVRQLVVQGTIKIDPLPPDHHFQPATVDITLADRFLVPCAWPVVDPYDLPDDLMAEVVSEKFPLRSGHFVLASSVERISLPSHIVARVEGRSSLGRLGLLIHSTAGFIDPGWEQGQITLELSNVAPWTITLHPGMRIGQIAFEHLDRPARRLYGDVALKSRYQGQNGPTVSRFAADTVGTNGVL